jgi:predicted small secreted protein
MMHRANRLQAHILFGLAAALLAACSTNAGFGTPATEPQPMNNGYPQSTITSPGPLASGMYNPNAIASPLGSPPPSPTPVPNTLSIVGAALRLAYDASAKDPVKAPRLLELSFALQNTTQNAAKISTVSGRAVLTQLPDIAVDVSAPANQTSQVASVVVKSPDDPQKYKMILFSFLDAQRKLIGTANLDVPPQDESFTGLDEHHPKGALSIDGAEISPIDVGPGAFFECTFALTNPSLTPASVSEFDIKPPKGQIIRIAIPMVVPMRSASGFVSMVVPYNGKVLPSGDYLITAQQNGLTLASASAVLL